MEKNNVEIIVMKGSKIPKFKDEFINFHLKNDEVVWKKDLTIKDEKLIKNIKEVYYLNKETFISAKDLLTSGKKLSRPKNTSSNLIQIKDGEFEAAIDCYVSEIGAKPGEVVDEIINIVNEFLILNN